ncbi:N-ethylmaleimide reductase [Verrucomicrobia bacterium IMCC26134]|jgi:N-ethylmaleimide reductase|nr:N-ethylmaleimide reductase [Verrucomicrobia bacterium IMCC26134]
MQLLTPAQLGSLSIPNRVLFAPLTRRRAGSDNVPGDLMADYYRQRASAGLLIAEATMVAADAQAWPHQPGIHSAVHAAGWRRVTDAVHAAGGRIYLQIWHPGRATHSVLNNGTQPVSSSNKPLRGDTIHTPQGKLDYPVPRALRTDEIAGIVELFRLAAVQAKQAGFDGVQVHGAHGYLIDQFLRDGVNDRTDAYGGSIANRARLLFEVVDAVASVFGIGRVGLRFSPLVGFNDMVDSAPAALVAHVAAEGERRGLGFLELRHANYDQPAEYELARIARKHFSGSLVRNGGFTRDAGEAAIRDGQADAIAYGVPFLANPDLPTRFLKNAPLNTPNQETFYLPGAPEGYTDYPFLKA